MRKVLFGVLTAAGFSFMGVQSGSAADLLPAPVPFSWTGFYIGAQGGGGAFDPTQTEDPGVGFLLGGQFGYNHQFGMLVLGVEGEGFWSGMKDQYKYACAGCDYLENTSYKNTADLDIAARVGLAIFDRALIYAKGGAAFANLSYNYNYSDTSGDWEKDTASGWVPGLLIGAGLQYALPASNHTSGTMVVGVEYNYIALNTTVLTASFACSAGYCTPATGTYDLNATGTKQIIKLRFDWLFNGPQ